MMLVLVLFMSSLLVFGFIPDGQSAERKLINIGWTGGSNWTSLPYQVADGVRVVAAGDTGQDSQPLEHDVNTLRRRLPALVRVGSHGVRRPR